MQEEEVKHYKVKSLPTRLRPNSVYYVKATSQSSVKTYITDQGGFPYPLIDLNTLSIGGIVNSLTGTGVTGTPNNPTVNISTFNSSQLGNLIQISSSDGKLFVKPITSPDGSIDISSTSSSLELQLGTSLQNKIQTALQPGDNISELNNNVGYITLADIPLSKVSATTWTPNHIAATGNPYLAGTIVYYLGHIFQANFTNDSILPTIGGNLYWTDLGIGYLIDQEQTDWLAVSGSAFIRNKPTNVSSFTNDVGYLTSFTETDPIFSSWLSTNPLSPYLLTTTAASTYLPIPSGTTLQYVRGDGSLDTFPIIPSITGLVPYTGATGDVDLGEHQLKVGQIEFDQTPTGTAGVAKLRWNDTDGTLDLGLKGGNVVLQLGQELLYEVRNQTGAIIENGTALYASGVTAGSGRITVEPYVADGNVREVRFLGLATEDISNGINGFVTYFGYVRGLDTRGTAPSSIAVGDENWQVGDVLYCHPTVAGKLTNIPPKHEISVAIVITRHQNSGVLFVRPTSYGHLDDIHDVVISAATNGDVLTYNTTTTVWENKTIIEDAIVDGVTDIAPSQNAVFDALATKQDTITNPITGTGANGQVAFWNGTNSQTGGNGLFWDNTNKRLGVGTASPTTALDVRGIITTRQATLPSFAADGSIMVGGSNVGGSSGVLLGVQIPYVTGAFGGHTIGYSNQTNPKWLIGISRNTTNENALFYMEDSLAANTRFGIFSGGNIGINTTTDAGFRFDVNGTTRLNGNTSIGGGTAGARLDVRAQGALSTDIAFRVRNSADTGDLFNVNGAGGAGIGSITSYSGRAISLTGGGANTNTNTIFAQLGYSSGSGTSNVFRSNSSFAPTSGNSVFNIFTADPTINQTGGANGITRGLFISPTLTSAFDFRAIETTVGNVTLNTTSGNTLIGTTTNIASSKLTVESTTQGVLLPRMTTAQRDAIVSPAVGLQIFNTTAGYLEYFDSFWGWMPIDNSNDWKRRNGTEYFNDFGQNNSFSDGVFQTFPLNGGGALTINPLPNTNDYIGFQGLTTGVNTNGGNSIRTDVNAGRFFNFSCGRKSFISRIWVLALSTVTDRYTILNGFSNSANSTMTTGACFIYDEGGVGTGTTASPNWQIITANGGVRTNFVTSVPVNITTWYSFRIESNANDSEIYYYINDILVRTEITNIPVASIGTQPIIAINKNTGTTNRGIAVDYLGLKIKLKNQR
jgi:hypothetical protein